MILLETAAGLVLLACTAVAGDPAAGAGDAAMIAAPGTVAIAAASGAVPAAAPAREIAIGHPGIVITRDTLIRPGTYRVTGAGEKGVLIVKGDGITLDFQGAELVGCPKGAEPDSFTGVAVISRGNNKVTIRNARIRGFKTAILVEKGDGVLVESCDLSGNYAQRLKSTPEREDGADWLWPHKNDGDEWRRNYGAGIWLKECKGAVVRGNTGHHSQNGILLSRVVDSQIYDNDFSFNSGWGLAMWRSTRNRVTRNKFDWCVRGYSHGVYWRGQDSAGILFFEQCSDNFFGWNSATHGGDGFFLYAGNETLRETGEGGCNRNVLYRNDFSHAVANGIEATFSEANFFIENICNDCQHGLWGGYSYNTWICGNEFNDCSGAGIAIEHGHDNVIEANTLARDPVAVDLWWDLDKDLMESPYGRKKNTDSADNRVVRNLFKDDKIAVRLRETQKTRVEKNVFVECGKTVAAGGKSTGTVIEGNLDGDAAKKADVAALLAERSRKYTPPKTKGSLEAFLPPGARRGRKYILIDEWGPYDFKEPKVWPARIAGGKEANFFIYGPEGPFRIESVPEGFTVTPMKGEVPGRFTVRCGEAGLHPFTIGLAAGEKRLTAAGTLLDATWTVKFFHWDPAKEDPRNHRAAWDKLLKGKPVDAMTTKALDFTWGGGSPSAKVRGDHFGTLAEAQIPLPAGTYEFRTISDDGVRLWVDKKLVIDNWTWHPPTENKAKVTLKAGTHRVRIEHFEIDGYSALKCSVATATFFATATGS